GGTEGHVRRPGGRLIRCPGTRKGARISEPPSGEPGRHGRKPDSVYDGHLSRPGRCTRPERPPFGGCPLPALFGPIWGCSVEGVTTFHRRRCRRRSSLWPFYSYSRPDPPGADRPVSHPSDRSAPPCDGLQLSAARLRRAAAESGLSSSSPAGTSDRPPCFQGNNFSQCPIIIPHRGGPGNGAPVATAS